MGSCLLNFLLARVKLLIWWDFCRCFKVLLEQLLKFLLISIWPGLMTHITVYLDSLVDLLTFNRILAKSLCRLFSGFMTLIVMTYPD